MFDKFAKKYDFRGNHLIDLQVVRSKSYLKAIEKYERENLKIQKLLHRYKIVMDSGIKRKRMVIEDEIFKVVDQIIAEKDPGREARLRSGLKMLHQMKSDQQRLNKIKERIHLLDSNDSHIQCAFITLQTVKDREFFKGLLGSNFQKIHAKFSKKKEDELLRSHLLVYAEEPPLPQAIKWKNYSFKQYQKMSRRFISWTLYILLYLLRSLLVLLFSCVHAEVVQRPERPSLPRFPRVWTSQ